MPTDLQLQILQNIRIASPCPARWEDMQGDDKRRYCTQCDLHVHNVAEMTADEVEDMLRPLMERGERVCAQLRRREDGTVLVRDCPVGLRAVRAHTRRMAARAVALASFLFTTAVLAAQGEKNPTSRARMVQFQPFKWAQEKLAPGAVVPPYQIMAGDLTISAPASAIQEAPDPNAESTTH